MRRMFFQQFIFTHRHYASFTPTTQQFFDNCVNLYARFGKNPLITDYLLLQHDSKKADKGLVYRFSFDEITGAPGHWLKKTDDKEDSLVLVPSVRPAMTLKGYQDAYGDILLKGETADHLKIIGRPLCNVEWEPQKGVSQTYTFYALAPKKTALTPTHTSRLKNSPEAQKIFKGKAGKYKECSRLIVKNSDVPKRCAIKERKPDQNTVMGFPAVKEYENCAQAYKSFLNPALTTMIFHVANIMHLSTLRSKEAKGIPVSDITRKIAHEDRLLRPEWLHLMSYGLHPMHKDPQYAENLGAARACDNTRMMLLEYAIRWFALNVPSSSSRLNGRFDLLLDTDVVDTITLIAQLSVNGAQCKLTQKIDALLLNPEHIHASDLAGLITLLSFLLQNKKPVSQEIEINCLPLTLPTVKKPTFFASFQERPPLIKEKTAHINGASGI